MMDLDKKKKKSDPKCALCFNHGINVLFKGHKRHCQHRDCSCFKCTETKKRQEYMADMQYIKRNGVAEEARLGKRADMVAIYNERMKNKKSKKKTLESEGSGEAASKSPVNKSITLESVDSNIQDLLNYFRDELRVTEDDDILFHSLVVLVKDLDETATESVLENIFSLYKEL